MLNLGGGQLLLYLNDIRIKLDFKGIVLYLITKHKENELNKYSSNYNNDVICLIAQLLHKYMTNEKADLKTWSDIIKNVNGEVIEDNRTAKEIEEDVLKMFRDGD